MAQLHCYVPDDLAKGFQDKARESNLPVFRHLALLIQTPFVYDPHRSLQVTVFGIQRKFYHSYNMVIFK